MTDFSVSNSSNIKTNSTTYNSNVEKSTGDSGSIFDKPFGSILSDFGSSISSTFGNIEHTVLDTKLGDAVPSQLTDSNVEDIFDNDNDNIESTSSDNNTSSNDDSSDKTINFEDGKFPSATPSTKEPAEILEENGNKFLRLTANYGDQEGISPGSKYPNRVRATMFMTKDHLNMPQIDSTNHEMSYSANIRFIDDKSKKGNSYTSFFELFQASSEHKPGSSNKYKYGDDNNPEGPVARFIRDSKGNVSLETQTKGSPKMYNIGNFPANKFYNFKIVADWSTTPDKGSYKVYVTDENGKEKQALDLEGITTCYWPGKTDLLPAMKCGLYGTNAVGSVDVDNVEIKNVTGKDSE